MFKTWIAYLGHIVSTDGVETGQKKVATITNWPQPSTVMDMQSFLGFTNNYRRFIHQYMQIARPLNLITSGDNLKKNISVEWRLLSILSEIKALMQLHSHSGLCQYNKPFKLHTNACGLGLGAVLYQTDDNGVDRVIAYASQKLSSS